VISRSGHLETLESHQSVGMFVTCSGPRQRPDPRDHGAHPRQPRGAGEVDALSAVRRVPASEHGGAPQHAQLAAVSAGNVFRISLEIIRTFLHSGNVDIQSRYEHVVFLFPHLSLNATLISKLSLLLLLGLSNL